MIGDFIYDLFHGLGPVVTLLALFLIFVIDAAIFPAIPEVFAVIFFLANPLPEGSALVWGVAILIMAVLGELAGNTLLYLVVRNLLVKKKRTPRILERMMKRYVKFLVCRDEKIILVNRVAPVVPMVGAFMAVCEWSYRKSISYVFIGSLAKYSFLLILVGSFGVMYERDTAQVISIVAVIVVIAVSALLSFIYRRRMENQ
jgi:membrane protein YqaA with SNARE-associated domain